MNRSVLFTMTIGALVITIGLTLLLTNPWSTNPADLDALRNREYLQTDRIAVFQPFDTLVFEKREGNWWYADEELELKAVENLVYAGGTFQLRSILPLEELDSVIHRTGFAFYNGNQQQARFSFLETTQRGVIYNGEGQEAFAVMVPGFETLDLRKIFRPEADHYRKQLLVSILPDEIASILVVPIDGAQFQVDVDGENNLVVSGLASGAILDERKMRLLFSYFNPIRFNRVLGARERVDGIVPLAQVSVTAKDGEVFHLRIYPIINENGSGTDLFRAMVLYNQEERLLEVDYLYLDLIIRGLESYLQKIPTNG